MLIGRAMRVEVLVMFRNQTNLNENVGVLRNSCGTHVGLTILQIVVPGNCRWRVTDSVMKLT